MIQEPEADTDAEDDAPNEHGAILTFVDDFNTSWHWKDRDAVTNISANAVRQFIEELSVSCAFVIYPSDDGGRVVLSALQSDFQVEADLGSALRDFARNDGWHADEKAAFKRVLQDVLKMLCDDPEEMT